ncbi:MAG: TonB-dependent receptor [Myxococcaceae bacterium]|nr:TonB-dependent receptor [Myxococcaceae bacterium]
MVTKRAIAIAVAISLLASTAGAQSDAPTAPPATSPAAPPAANDPTAAPAPLEEARVRYQRAIELFDAGDYKLALVEFERVATLAPSPKLLYNIGLVHFQLGNYAKARTAYERYLTEVPDMSPERRAQVEKDVASLRGRTAYVTVTTNVPGAEISFDDGVLGTSPLAPKQLVNAGMHRITAEKSGFATAAKAITLAGGDSSTLDLVLVPLGDRPPPPPPPSSPTNVPALVGWITSGTLAVGAITTGVASLVASSKYDDMRASKFEGSPQDARDRLSSQRSLVQGLALTTDILGIAAIVAGGVSLYLTLKGTSQPEQHAPVAKSDWRLVW